MHKDQAIPLYYQVESILRRQIVSGERPAGSALPSEESLCKEFDVSRITMRRALSILVEDGLIVRQRGRGSFVTDQVPRVDKPRFSGSMEDLIAMGVRTEARVLSFEMIPAPETVRRKLELPQGSRVLRVEKVRSIEGKPFSYVINYLPEEIGQRLDAEHMSQKPLLMILEEELGLTADNALQTIEAVVAEPQLAPLLGVRVGEPLLKSERVVCDPQGNPLEYVWVLYRADKYFFTVGLKRERDADSPGWMPSRIN